MELLYLQQSLDIERSKRKSELTFAMELALRPAEEQHYLCRAWIVFLYAHCESFLKKSASLYLEYIAKNDIPYDIRPFLLMYNGINNFTDDKVTSFIENALEDDKKTLCDEKFMKNIIDLKNFRRNTLDIYFKYIFQFNDDFNTSLSTISSLLVNARNKIAHGEETDLQEPEHYIKWHNPVICFMDDVVDHILDKVTQS